MSEKEKVLTKYVSGSAEFKFDDYGTIFRIYNMTDGMICASVSEDVTLSTGLHIPTGGCRDLCTNANPKKDAVFNAVYIVAENAGNVEVQELWY